MSDHPRILVVEGSGRLPEPLRSCLDGCDVARADSPAQALEALRDDSFEALLADPRDPALRDAFADLARRGRTLDALPDGVAVVDAGLRVIWANPAFERCSGGPAGGRAVGEALGDPQALGPNSPPFAAALAGRPAVTRLHSRDNRHFEIRAAPLDGAGAAPDRLVVVVRDVTAQVQQQQQLDALHRAGEELAPFTADDLAEMSAEQRIETLKQNIKRLTHDRLRYDVIEIRLLDRHTGRLEPLLEEGMTPAAAGRDLYARPKGNGVTGYVAASGQTYLCNDTCQDPLYLEGCAGARSSLTVPLLYEDEVIGTFNVESPKPDGFGDRDVQFAEIFCREIASALHTLELLTAEKHGTAARSVEAVSREVALPVDDILTAATAVLDRYIGHDDEMAAKLKQILAGARAIKQTIQKVGEAMAPAKAPAGGEDGARPRLKGKRVLVADNDDRVRRSAHGLLGRWGCVVETARDGREAVTMARLGSYDHILADIRLPDMPGYEVYRELRRAQPQARVVLMTAYGYDPSHALVKARQDGLRFVLYKPFRADQLLTALESADAPAPSPPPQVVRA